MLLSEIDFDEQIRSDVNKYGIRKNKVLEES